VRLSSLAGDVLRRSLIVAGLMVGTAAIAAPVVEAGSLRLAKASVTEAVQKFSGRIVQPRPTPARLVWESLDVDGDGAGDFANPTGQEPRQADAYGEGRYGASRDGGMRRHEGVDYKADAGQAVIAPISGFITKVGYAYADDRELKFVEITNPALRYAARVFYVDPSVMEGQVVAMGDPIGRTHTLQDKYPGGMTNHVHLEIIRPDGRRIDPDRVLQARWIIPDIRG
jgi:peptidoglycan LD-endopeptidase LytH